MRTLKKMMTERDFPTYRMFANLTNNIFFSRLAAKELVSPDKNDQINDEDYPFLLLLMKLKLLKESYRANNCIY